VFLRGETARLALRHAIADKSVEIRERLLVPDCLEDRTGMRLSRVTALAASRIDVFATGRLFRGVDPTLRRNRICTWRRAGLRRCVARQGEEHGGGDDGEPEARPETPLVGLSACHSASLSETPAGCGSRRTISESPHAAAGSLSST